MTVKKANPMTTKTGKPRLGPLNIAQLRELLAKTTKKKIRAQITRRINVLETREICILVQLVRALP